MKKSIVIVTVILATVLLLGLGTAMARDAILFPYFTSGGGNVTFFQIINTAKVQTPLTGTSQGSWTMCITITQAQKYASTMMM